jgi:hypothetical protein
MKPLFRSIRATQAFPATSAARKALHLLWATLLTLGFGWQALAEPLEKNEIQ